MLVCVPTQSVGTSKFGEARRADIDLLLLDKLPDVLSDKQKTHKTKSLLQFIKNQCVISVSGKVWSMSRGKQLDII